MELNKQLWNQRYLDSNTGWDVGYITTPLKDYIDQIQNKEVYKITSWFKETLDEGK